jgi:hypothetical protein
MKLVVSARKQARFVTNLRLDFEKKIWQAR